MAVPSICETVYPEIRKALPKHLSGANNTEQCIQASRVEQLATQNFVAVVVQLASPDRDMLLVRVEGKDHLYHENGESCSVTIEGATFAKTGRKHVDAAFEVYSSLLDVEASPNPLEKFNHRCGHLCRPLSQSEFDELFRNDTEIESNDNVEYKERIQSAYHERTDLFSHTVMPNHDAPVADIQTMVDDKNNVFRGHSIGCTDLRIPRNYAPMLVTHPKSNGAPTVKAGLSYVQVEIDESLVDYIARVGDEGHMRITITIEASPKTLQAQSYALNAVKTPQTANPQPSLSSQEAYRYMMRFNTNEISTVNILKELPGLGNVVTYEGAPVDI
ncbi:hypothetical protein ACHAP5_011836 [Fusarium lateritium]